MEGECGGRGSKGEEKEGGGGVWRERGQRVK